MRTVISGFWSKLFGTRKRIAAPAPARDEREIARGLAASLDRAMQLGLWEHADRLAAGVGRLAERHPALAERLARLRLKQDNTEACLSVIDSCPARSASLRLLRAVCLLKTGRRAEAHFDLNEWSRRSTAPLQARLLAAMLEFQNGDPAAAIQELRRNLRQIEDPRTLAALALVCTGAGLKDQARLWADRLRSLLDWHPAGESHDLMLASLDLSSLATTAASTAPSESLVRQLAQELATNEPVIGALAEAQRLRCEPRTADLLRRAINRIMPELADQDAAYEALRTISQAMESAAGSGEAPITEPDRRDVLATIGKDAVGNEQTTQERAA